MTLKLFLRILDKIDLYSAALSHLADKLLTVSRSLIVVEIHNGSNKKESKDNNSKDVSVYIG